MNLGEVKTRAIQLINEYSNNGGLISDAKNADYRLRMNNLANYCQNEISDKVGIEAVYTINDVTTIDVTEDGYKKYNLPTNYKDHRFVRWNSEAFYEYRIENGQYWHNEGLTGTFSLYYFRYPTDLDQTTSDDYVFEIDRYAHSMIPYYLGGIVIADENQDISNKLLNIYYERLGNIYKRTVQYPKRGRDVVRW